MIQTWMAQPGHESVRWQRIDLIPQPPLWYRSSNFFPCADLPCRWFSAAAVVPLRLNSSVYVGGSFGSPIAQLSSGSDAFVIFPSVCLFRYKQYFLGNFVSIFLLSGLCTCVHALFIFVQYMFAACIKIHVRGKPQPLAKPDQNSPNMRATCLYV